MLSLSDSQLLASRFESLNVQKQFILYHSKEHRFVMYFFKDWMNSLVRELW